MGLLLPRVHIIGQYHSLQDRFHGKTNAIDVTLIKKEGNLLVPFKIQGKEQSTMPKVG